MERTNKRYEIILAGSGGQGMVLAGIILAEAAILEGRNVVQTQTYSAATRGGVSLAEVIIDEDEIIFQQVQKPDCILVLSEEMAKKYEAWAAKGVPILYDSTLVNARTMPNFRGYAFTQMATDLGSQQSVNILALGTVVAQTGAVEMKTLEKVIRKRFKGPDVEMNLKMLAAGNALENR